MTFKELQAAMVAAMKEKNRVKKEVIADMVACAKNMAIEKGCKDNITDEIVAAAILKSRKCVKTKSTHVQLTAQIGLKHTIFV